MRIGVISDIHANHEALTAVLQAIESESIDETFAVGDIVGYGPDPDKCIRTVVDNGIASVYGNHEELVNGTRDAMEYNDFARTAIDMTVSKLSSADLAYLRDLPEFIHYKNLSFSHTLDVKPEDYFFRHKKVKPGFFPSDEYRCGFVGHTHKAALFILNEDNLTVRKEDIQKDAPYKLDTDAFRYIVDVGSVGQPRDKNTKASWVIMDTDRDTIEFRRTSYDLSTTQRKMEKLGMPSYLRNRLTYGN